MKKLVLLLLILSITCIVISSCMSFSSGFDLDSFSDSDYRSRLSSQVYGNGQYTVEALLSNYEYMSSSLAAFNYCYMVDYRPILYDDVYSIAIMSAPYHGTAYGEDVFLYVITNPNNSKDYIICSFYELFAKGWPQVIPSCIGGYVLCHVENGSVSIIDADGNIVHGRIYRPEEVNIRGSVSNSIITDLKEKNIQADSTLLFKAALEFAEKAGWERVHVIYSYKDFFGHNMFSLLSDGRLVDYISGVVSEKEQTLPKPGFAYITNMTANDIFALTSSNSYTQIYEFQQADYYSNSVLKDDYARILSDKLKNDGYYYANYICVRYLEDIGVIEYATYGNAIGLFSLIDFKVYAPNDADPVILMGFTMQEEKTSSLSIFSSSSFPCLISDYGKLDRILFKDSRGNAVSIDPKQYAFEVKIDEKWPYITVYIDVSSIIDSLSQIIERTYRERKAIITLEFTDSSLNCEVELTDDDLYQFSTFYDAYMNAKQ